MAVRDIKEYYNKICEDYMEMLDEIKALEKEIEQKIVPPETIDNLRNLIKPLIANYQQISYFMYLLNMPNRKNKQSKYKKQENKKIENIASSNTPEAKLAENKQILEKLKIL